MRPRETKPPTWDEAVDAYIRDCRRRNLSPSTLREYEYVLCESMRIRVWRRDYGIDTIDRLNRETLEAFEADITDAGLRVSTIATLHRRLHTFGRFCQRQYGFGGSVIEVVAPIEPEREPEVYSDDEVQLMLDYAPCLRDRLILETFLATGIRLEELTQVTIDDIQETTIGVLLHVHGKGRKDRVVAVDTPHNALSARLRRYISFDRPKADDRALFLTRNRSGGEHVGLTRRGAQEILRRLARATGIQVHAHRFRHTFATRAIQAGVNPLILQRVLGHTSQRMTSRYVHTQGEDVLREWASRRD